MHVEPLVHAPVSVNMARTPLPWTTVASLMERGDVSHAIARGCGVQRSSPFSLDLLYFITY